jgi:hypothetical protein
MNGQQILLTLGKDPVTLAKCTGVFASDRLPHDVPVDQFCVCNTDKWNNNGKHWIVIYFPRHGPTEYFDPLGKEPRDDFVPFMGDEYLYNTQRYQPMNSNACAYFCIFFAYMKSRGIPFQSMKGLLASERNIVKFVEAL